MEFKKLVNRRKFLIAVLLILLLNITAYLHFFCVESDIEVVENIESMTERDSEEIKYKDLFRSNAEQIIANAEKMSSISIFANSDEFANKNIEQTKNDYERIKNVEIKEFHYDSFEKIFAYKWADIFIVFFALIIGVCYIDTGNIGLERILYASKSGRFLLYIKRVVAIFVWNCILVSAVYLPCILLSLMLGKNDISILIYSVQSVPIFMDLTLKINIAVFLLFFILIKALICSLLSLVIWTIFSNVKNIIVSLTIIVAAVIGEYICYIKIGVNSPISILHYVNYFYVLKTIFFTEYVNINFFGVLFNKYVLTSVVVCILCFVFALASVLIGERRYPAERKNYFTILSNKLTKLQDFFGKYTYEIYKALICQKGIFVLLLIIFVIIQQTDFRQIYQAKDKQMYIDFMNEYEGVRGEASVEYLDSIRERIIDAEREFDEASIKYENGEITSSEMDFYSLKLEAMMADVQFLNSISIQDEYLDSLEKEKVWYVNLYTYNNLFANERIVYDLILIIALAIFAISFVVVEKTAETRLILNAAKEGRETLYNRKKTIIAFAGGLVLALEIFLSILSVYINYGIRCLNAPLISIPKMRNYPEWITIAEYILGYNVFKIVLAILLIIISFKTCDYFVNRRAE